MPKKKRDSDEDSDASSYAEEEEEEEVKPAKKQAKKEGKKKDVGESAQDKAEHAESDRLRDLAFKHGLFSRTKPSMYSVLKPSSDLKKLSNSVDIYKKHKRKGEKYVFVFPGRLSFLQAGKIGEVAALDTKNPVVYLDCGKEGRLKLMGTLMYPKASYSTIRLGSKEKAQIDDVFETLVVFSEAIWIGRKEENPNEKPMAWPAAIKNAVRKDLMFKGGASKGEGKASDSKGARRTSSVGSDGTPATKRESSRPARSATATSYKDSDGSDGDDSASDSDF